MNNIPAFPGPYMTAEGAVELLAKQGGMTLRDYFAAKAIQGLIAHESKASELSGANLGNFDVRVAFAAYRYADGMLKARDEA